MTQKVALVLGVGAVAGLGCAIAQKFGGEGHHVVVVGRTAASLDTVVAHLAGLEISASAKVADVCEVDQVAAAFTFGAGKGELDAVIYNAGNNAPTAFMDITPESFERFWRLCCFGAFLVAQEAVRHMLPRGKGTVLFTGASASMRGKAGFAHFASGKAALRNMIQSLAREYGPQGLHVGHVVVDGVINGEQVQSRYGAYLDNLGEDGALDIHGLASSYWYLHSQGKSTWTHELDLRPFKESW